MGDLVLSGTLNLVGSLTLVADGGKVVVAAGPGAGAELLVTASKGVAGAAQGRGAVPVLLPPNSPSDVAPGTDAWIFSSFNASVQVRCAGGQALPVVALGMCAQGDPVKATWPGMVLPSTRNAGGVTIAGVPANVMGDTGVILPNGGPVTFDVRSGQ